MGKHRAVKKSQCKTKRWKLKTQETDLVNFEEERHKVRASVLNVFKNRLKSPGGGPAIIISESESQSQKSDMKKREHIKNGYESSSESESVIDYKSKNTKRLQKLNKNERGGKLSHKHKHSQRPQKQAMNNSTDPQRVTKVLSWLNKAKCNESTALLGSNRLTRRLGIFNNGKKSDKIVRISKKAQKDVEVDMKCILDVGSVQSGCDSLKYLQSSPSNDSYCCSKDQICEQNSELSNVTNKLRMKLSYQTIANDLCSFLRPKDVFPGRDMFSEFRAELLMMMPDCEQHETPCRSTGSSSKCANSVQRALFCNEKTPVDVAFSTNKDIKLKSGTNISINELSAMFGKSGNTRKMRNPNVSSSAGSSTKQTLQNYIAVDEKIEAADVKHGRVFPTACQFVINSEPAQQNAVQSTQQINPQFLSDVHKKFLQPSAEATRHKMYDGVNNPKHSLKGYYQEVHENNRLHPMSSTNHSRFTKHRYTDNKAESTTASQAYLVGDLPQLQETTLPLYFSHAESIKKLSENNNERMVCFPHAAQFPVVLEDNLNPGYISGDLLDIIDMRGNLNSHMEYCIPPGPNTKGCKSIEKQCSRCGQTEMVTASPDSDGFPAWKLVNIKSPCKPVQSTPTPPKLCARRMY